MQKQLAAVERARAAANDCRLEAVELLPATHLRVSFSRQKAKAWKFVKLGDVSEVVSGVTLGRKIRNGETRKVPYLRVANVKDGYLDLDDVYGIEATESEIESLRLEVGDLLLTEGGDRDKLGRGTFWNGEVAECIHQNHIYRVRFPRQRFLPEFVSAQLGLPYGKAYFLAHAKQTTGIATINQRVLKAFPLMSPPIHEQKLVARHLAVKLEGIKGVRDALSDELNALNLLPAAILRCAFSGGL